MVKLTFSVDEATARLLRDTAQRRAKPQSLVVREAIAQYAERENMLPAGERKRLLGVLNVIKNRPRTRRASEVDRELRDITRSRRTGWSRPVR